MLTRRYPSLLTSDLIARLESALTSSSSSPRSSAVQELRNEYNLARVDQRSLEKLSVEKRRLFKLKEGNTASSTATIPTAVTIVSVVGSEGTTTASREVQRGAEVVVLQPPPSSSSSYQRSSSSSGATTTTTPTSSPYLTSNSHSGSSYVPPSSHVIRYPTWIKLKKYRYRYLVFFNNFLSLIFKPFFCPATATASPTWRRDQELLMFLPPTYSPLARGSSSPL